MKFCKLILGDFEKFADVVYGCRQQNISSEEVRTECCRGGKRILENISCVWLHDWTVPEGDLLEQI